jgi:hypothetical protein
VGVAGVDEEVEDDELDEEAAASIVSVTFTLLNAVFESVARTANV